jgi:hypothetical protein
MQLSNDRRRRVPSHCPVLCSTKMWDDSKPLSPAANGGDPFGFGGDDGGEDADMVGSPRVRVSVYGPGHPEAHPSLRKGYFTATWRVGLRCLGVSLSHLLFHYFAGCLTLSWLRFPPSLVQYSWGMPHICMPHDLNPLQSLPSAAPVTGCRTIRSTTIVRVPETDLGTPFG